MGFSYYYKFSACHTVTATELEAFLRKVDGVAKTFGFNPTTVLTMRFATTEQLQVARRITSGLLVTDERLKGVTLLDESKVWDYDRTNGTCRVIPEKCVMLIVTDEQGREVLFGFLKFPDSLKSISGKELTVLPTQGRWIFEDFVNSPDERYRKIVNMFADAGYLECQKDEFK